MKDLLTIDETTFGRESLRQTGQYWQRQAVRAVVLDAKDRVYLMHIGQRNTYKLPGGGVDDGEDLAVALARELMEEVGVSVEVIDELGQITEYRDADMMKQVSYCYLARQVGYKGSNSLEPDEVAKGMREVLVDNIDQAIDAMISHPPTEYYSQYMHLRELTILRAAKPVIDQL